MWTGGQVDGWTRGQMKVYLLQSALADCLSGNPGNSGL
jgi:hypothetical protein